MEKIKEKNKLDPEQYIRVKVLVQLCPDVSSHGVVGRDVQSSNGLGGKNIAKSCRSCTDALEAPSR